MRRLLATLLTAGLLVSLAGCSKNYAERLELTLERLKYLQRLDQFLTRDPVGDPLQPANIYLRPPQNMTKATQTTLSADPAQFDVIATFLDVSGEPAKEAAAPPPVIRLHVLARRKQAATPAKKGEPAPPPVERLPFEPAVLEVLARDLGGLDPATADQLIKSDKKRLNDYKRLIFDAASGDTIRVYFYVQDDYEVALIWDIPKPLEKPPATTAIELALESLSVGPRAAAAFQGIDVEEGFIPGTPAAGGAASPAAAF